MNAENYYISIKESLGLSGTITVEGAKNAILPIIPAVILTSGISIIENVPSSKDIHKTLELASFFNIKYTFCNKNKKLILDTFEMINARASTEAYQATRASTIFAGALLGRFGEAYIALPGGDNIGKRPIDIHLEAFRKCGAEIFFEENYIVCKGNNLQPADIFLDYPSVGATQNILLLVSQIEGKSVIRNAAQEPEIHDLITVLRQMGVEITYEYPGTIIIHGTKKLKSFNHIVIPDRLEAGTFLLAAAITGGSVHIPNAPAYCMEAFLKKLSSMGHKIEISKDGWGVFLEATENPQSISIKTMPYPGYPTDLQSPMMALLAKTPGIHRIHETVFENRMKHAYELNKLGARISIEYDCAQIEGVSEFNGAHLVAGDIRSCSALILAGLASRGTTTIDGVNHLLRGYENLDIKLRSLGADISIAPKTTLVTACLNYENISILN